MGLVAVELAADDLLKNGESTEIFGGTQNNLEHRPDERDKICLAAVHRLKRKRTDCLQARPATPTQVPLAPAKSIGASLPTIPQKAVPLRDRAAGKPDHTLSSRSVRPDDQ